MDTRYIEKLTKRVDNLSERLKEMEDKFKLMDEYQGKLIESIKLIKDCLTTIMGADK